MTTTDWAGPSMPSAAAGREVELARRLTRGPARWGWEFVEPAPIRPCAERSTYPQWSEPAPPQLYGHQAHLNAMRDARTKRFVAAGVGALVGLSFLTGGYVATFFIGLLLLAGAGLLAYFAVSSVHKAEEAIAQVVREAANYRESEMQRFLTDRARWDAHIAAWDAAERARHEATPVQFPIVLGDPGSQVNVFGGAGRGWESLLATVGSSSLGAGTSVLVLDLSGEAVSGSLVGLARDAGVPVSAGDAPASFAGAGFLDELDHRTLADVLAESLASMRARSDAYDLRAMDADLTSVVLDGLDNPVSFARLAAGVKVLRAVYDVDNDGPLSLTEVRRLSDQVDVVDKSERIRDELRFLQSQFELLAGAEAPGGTSTQTRSLWDNPGLTVITSQDLSRSRKDLVDAVLFHLVSHHLAAHHPRGGGDTVVVAGADRLGRDSLEALARHARRASVRLVYLFEHLREDTADLLGGANSASVFMRLGNHKEATEAAEHVGKEYRFVLSQISTQHGTNESRGTTNTHTTNEGWSETVGTSTGSSSGHGGASSNRSSNWSRSQTGGTSDAVGTSFSFGTSRTDGETQQRCHEFTFEPTTFQGLSPSCFVLVDAGSRGRRAVAGDFNPAMVFFDRVSSDPR